MTIHRLVLLQEFLSTVDMRDVINNIDDGQNGQEKKEKHQKKSLPGMGIEPMLTIVNWILSPTP